MKYETYGEYDPRAVAQTQPAFLTVWSGLGHYHDELVLVGGLVIVGNGGLISLMPRSCAQIHLADATKPEPANN